MTGQKFSSLNLKIGPLRYTFIAHDEWGRGELLRLRQNLDSLDFSGVPDRVFHLIEFSPTSQEQAEINTDILPHRLAKILPDEQPGQGWKLNGDETGYMCWYHSQTPLALWTYRTIPANFQAPFQLPWFLILEDMVKAGGGVMHAGLAVLGGVGTLFLAPPGGGKTTTLSRLPSPWQVLADDAVLIWPGGDGGFLASPLPTWSVLLGKSERMNKIDRWQVGKAYKIGSAIVLEKRETCDRLSLLNRIEATIPFYYSLVEHPRVFSNSLAFRKNLFNTASELALAVPTYQLELSLDGNFWTLIEDLTDNG